MSAPTVCPKCGFANPPGWTYCTNCGSPSRAAVSPTGAPPTAPAYPAAVPYPAYPGAPPYAYGASPLEAERRKQTDRTKLGVLLLLFGAVLSWIPLVSLIGALLTLIGAILVILGRKAFGATHRRNVVISIILFFVGILFVFIGGVIAGVVAFGALSSTATEAEIAATLRDAITNILVVAAVGSFVSGLASVFFTYALQKLEGRILLWAAYGATAASQVAILVVTLPLVADIAATIAHAIVTTQTVNAAEIQNAISGAAAGLTYLSVIPSLLYAGANYLAWNRINKGEIPPPMMPPAAPAMGPPGPPIQPQ